MYHKVGLTQLLLNLDFNQVLELNNHIEHYKVKKIYDKYFSVVYSNLNESDMDNYYYLTYLELRIVLLESGIKWHTLTV